MARKPVSMPDLSNPLARTEPEKKKKTTPVGVLLTPEQLEKLKAITAELGLSRHEVLKYAVRVFIERWDSGWRPEVEEQIIKKLK